LSPGGAFFLGAAPGAVPFPDAFAEEAAPLEGLLEVTIFSAPGTG
jgi:hypothetical protein